MSDYNSIFQHAWYNSNNLNAVMYGIYLCLNVLTIHFALRGRRRASQKDPRSNMLFIAFSVFLLVFITMWGCIHSVFSELMWITNANYPGGSGKYWMDFASVWYQGLAISASVTIIAGTDAFLVYRLYVVWGFNKPIVAVPCVLYLASVALGICTAVSSALPDAVFFNGTSARIALAYSAVSMALNVLCTTFICARMIWMAREMGDLLGADVTRTYTTAVAVIIESMLPYTIAAVGYLVTLGVHSPLAIFFLSPYVMFSVLSPQMIMLRVLMGRGISAETNTKGVSSVRFRGTGAPDTRMTSDETEEGSAAAMEHTAIQLPSLSKSSLPQTKLTQIM
ncbi:uncharacterized protein BXZ73DRAFT_45963 [Epithele typhae]|uniref:uncharacterized protein n=1 Tax=Epithele typhae TaxID=378194 RepID=UPI00200795C8|nr:uncharacterized protein BXZ73DRAFT_45963 [Epithele typhae]KAH9934035.1 hypothetical protein BXZ73DRAFT_45963 [Epithele typhae]